MIPRVGIAIIIIGLVISVVTGMNLLTREEVVDIAEVNVSRNIHTYLVWTPLIGIGVMFLGGYVIYVGVREQRAKTPREKR